MFWYEFKIITAITFVPCLAFFFNQIRGIYEVVIESYPFYGVSRKLNIRLECTCAFCIMFAEEFQETQHFVVSHTRIICKRILE